MPDNDLKQSLQHSLARFANGKLADNARDLFNVLGYRSDKTVKLASSSPQAFVAQFKGSKSLIEENALFAEWTSADLIFQLTSAEVAHTGQRTLFEGDRRVDNKIIESYVFLAIGLRGDAYTRTQLAAITREVNKVFPMPALILFQHGNTLTLAVIDHRVNKRDESKDVLEKVTLIKDIRCANPHRAHIEILFDLALEQLNADGNIKNWVNLHEAWRATLDTSELNKKFFREVANWYFWAQSKVKFPKGAGRNEDERKAISVIRLLTRLIFVWFVREKNLVPDELFDKRRVDELLKYDDPKDSTYYKAILQNLFFGTLNTEMDTRDFRHQPRQSGGRADDYMAHNRYRYEKYFKKPDEFLKLCAPVPFLNGGLFECLDKSEDERADGFSDRPDNELVVPDDLFFGKERDIDLNEIYGTSSKRSKVRGLIHIFDSYKFTVDENTPIEEEIALDPELLGKVFENLLAAYNPETGVTARKQTGSFYTPREIVNYMVDESLVAYLETKLVETGNYASEDSRQNLNTRLRHLLSYNNEPHQFSHAEVDVLMRAIDQLKVLDPACGSGAFPMGMLHKLVYVLRKLDPDNTRWKALQIARANAMEDAQERASELADIEDAFANDADYARKLYIIENCLYGVDVQPIAVQIAKLRCFISLIVDDKVDDNKPNRGIRPLPNLETKFVAANSLIGVERPVETERPRAENKPQEQLKLTPKMVKLRDELVEVLRQYLKTKKPDVQKKYLASGEAVAEELNRAFKDVPGFAPINANWVFTTARSVDDLIDQLPGAKQEQATAVMFRSDDIEEKEKQLAEVRRSIFGAHSYARKKLWRERDRKLRAEIAELLKKSGWGDATAGKLAAWDPYEANVAAAFFDAEWMFGVSGGFGIVMGNPPYIEFKKMLASDKELYASYSTATGKYDIYVLFIESSAKVLNPQGTLCFINPTTFMKKDYGSGLREFISGKLGIVRILDFGDIQVFENATNYTGIFFFSADRKHDYEFQYHKYKNIGREIDVTEFSEHLHTEADFKDILKVRSSKLGVDTWNFQVAYVDSLLARIQKDSDLLSVFVAEIFEGIASGKDEVFYIGEDVIARNGIEKGVLFPLLKGKDIKAYSLDWSGTYVIYPYDKDSKVYAENDMKRLFPNALEYLRQNRKLLSGRGYFEKSNKLWFELWNQRKFQNFSQLRIVSPEISDRNNFAFTDAYFGNTKTYHIILKNRSQERYLAFLGLLNSSLLDYVYKLITTPHAGGFYAYKSQFLNLLPISKRLSASEEKIAVHVRKILAAKRKDADADTSALEREIDALVYQLYGLTAEEIKVVEGSV